MKEEKLFSEKHVSEKQWFWFLAFVGLITRFPLLRMFSAETTDAVFSLTYFTTGWTQTHHFGILPGHPLLLWVGQWFGLSGWLWGRIVSAAAGLIFLIPLWKFSRRWISVEMTGIVCLMAIFSPLLWQWSLRISADTLFLLAFWWCLERLTTTFIDKNKNAWTQGCLAAALAACVRPEGFLLFPWVLYLGEREFSEGRWKRRTILILLWLTPLFFIKERFMDILYAYQEGAGLTSGFSQVRFPILNFIDHLYTYLSQPLYVFTPLIFWFSVLGLAKMCRRNDPVGSAFKKIVLQVYVLVLLSRLIPTIYQDRHMFPFLPLLLLAAGVHIETFFESLDKNNGRIQLMFWKNGLITLCIAWLALFSSAVLISQNDSFGDIKRSSEFLKTLPADAVIYTDEVPKTQYWSQRKVILMPYLEENTQFNPKPGDYVVLHSFYIPRIGQVDQYLVRKNGAELLREESSMVVPLLTDVMENPAIQNRTKAAAFRFEPQFFRSRVYRIPPTGRKGKP